ncbi:MAG: UPF0280 family protein [Dictyoglomus sp.]|nr:UPF0280 family protein [Dictyoglomus sp.]MDW8189281.1 UPF0280 family protein [Dictyoglomus sp.]
MSNKYVKREYRRYMKSSDLISFPVKIKESDLYILAEKNLEKEAEKILEYYRGQLEEYIKIDPLFQITLEPHKVLPCAPKIAKEMAYWSEKAGVGPMASVAGAIAEFVGKDLLKLSSQVIVENGGDIFLSSKKERIVSIFAGESPWSNKLGILVPPSQALGICTSSATVGPSLSFGNADAVVIVSKSAIFADALATAVGNMIQKPEDIDLGIEYAKGFKEVFEVIIILGEHLGVWGRYEIVKI